MAERTNLITPNSPIKYILGSILLLAVSGVGIFWLIGQNKKQINEITIPVITPTKAILKAKEGEFCGAGPKGVVQCEDGLECNETGNITTNDNGTTLVKQGVGGICEKLKNDDTGTETKKTTITPSLTTTPIVTLTNDEVTPTIKLIEIFESKEDGFSVRYDSKRKLTVETEDSGKRYVFSNYLGNITVHTGKEWSWVNSGRTFTDTFLVGGEKSYVYDISNQKIIDIEKDDNKYTIQCVHNAKEELKKECQKFLEDFKFI
ncbi:MAG: hypothetical protein WC503_01625 [Candidatus Shapirobacteria bacterium]